mmetsp:Transcript_15767/g.37431  ORF Transcript_15767/g.37431 Transcript_15767/m.37431 type:complete len:261 (-) Transcript_15767:252-1034(-)
MNEEVQNRACNRVRRLHSAIQAADGTKPSHKEWRESLEFVNKIKKYLQCPGTGQKVVIDVAGSHGLVALLCLALANYDRAIVIDPARPKSFDTVVRAWASFFSEGALASAVDFVQHGLAEALPDAIARETALGSRVTVLACHACQHLSDQVMDIATAHGVPFAVMPCCHKDPTGAMKSAAAAVGAPLGVCMDLATLGRVSERGYRAKLLAIDPGITPHNRVIAGVPAAGGEDAAAARAEAERRLRKAYARAHAPATPRPG